MEIKSVLVSECYTNCYLVKNKETNEGFIIDPGDNALKISRVIEEMQMKPQAVLLTHGHWDHIGAVDDLRDRYGIKVYVSEAEADFIKSSKYNLSVFFNDGATVTPDVYLKDGDIINIAGIEIKFILTPGHSPGSGCYYIKDKNVLFSGDTLFCASRGRSDLPGGSESEIINSIKNKLLILPDDTDVFPGHEALTTIADEKIYY